jgi:hypothetical protein
VAEQLLFDVTRAANQIATNVAIELRELQTKNIELKTKLAQTESRLADLKVELRQALVDQGRKQVIDLPPMPLRSVN